MSGETKITQPEQPVYAPEAERQPVSEQKTAAETNDSTAVKARIDLLKIENRFARLKRHLRKRSASIL